jgi:AraC family transcriptional regulator
MTLFAADFRHDRGADASQIRTYPSIDPNETHRISSGPGCTQRASSATLGWRNIFVTTQAEIPRQATYNAVRHLFLVLLLSGPARVTLKTAGHRVNERVAAGSCTLCPGGDGFAVQISDPLESAHFYLRDEMIERVLLEHAATTRSSPKLQPFLGLHDPLAMQLAHACISVLSKHSQSCSLYVDHLAWALAAHLVEMYGDRPKPLLSNHSHRLTDRQLRRVEEYMREHLDGNIGVDDLATAAGLSPIYFARKFKRCTGSSPYRHLQSIRIERAKELLADDNISIAEIALMCGFCHQEHMTRVFKKDYGTTPAAFRRRSIK